MCSKAHITLILSKNIAFQKHLSSQTPHVVTEFDEEWATKTGIAQDQTDKYK